MTTEADAGQPVDPTWIPSSADAGLAGPIAPGSPGRTHTGGNLDLHMGWDRFEKLILALSRSMLGLRGIDMRRYGVPGQAQHGIDLAGREPDNRYTVIQCKEYQDFSAADLREAVEKFANGIRPYDAYRFIVATSHSTQSTQVADALLELQDEYVNDLKIELWGADEINDQLRSQAGIVARFWTRETANDFCTGAPLAGVPAPPPNRQEQAEQILLGPLETDSFVPILRSAEALRTDAPAEAAILYGDLALRLDESGFRGHSSAMRLKQLESLRAAQKVDDAADLAASLAVYALRSADEQDARKLGTLLAQFAGEAEAQKTARATTTRLHARLVGSAIEASLRVTDAPDALLADIRSEGAEQVEYFAHLVLLLSEDIFATDPERLSNVSDLIDAAIAGVTDQAVARAEKDLRVRLRLLKAEYENAERLQLAKEARRHQLGARQASLVSAREARRCCLEGRVEEAQENWRDAIQDAIHCGLMENAAQWLYAIRALNVRYGPWTIDLDDEHRLAQALRRDGGGNLINRVRDSREQAMSSLARGKPIEAVISSRRWLADSVVSGAWASECEALEFLGDLYRGNREVGESAKLYRRAGAAKKIEELTADAKDAKLPIGALEAAEPWWVLHAQATIISAQEDLLDDEECTAFIDRLLELLANARAGKLADSPTRALLLQATRTLCDIVHRGTLNQANETLDALAPELQRPAGGYRHTDEAHASMCVRLAESRRETAMPALSRLFDLAKLGTHKALELIADDQVLQMLMDRESSDAHNPARLSPRDARELRERALQLVRDGRHLADAAVASLEPGHELVVERAQQARDRILQREDPDPHAASFGTMMVTDSYLVANCLPAEDQNACLDKLLEIANDPRETASNRRDALAGVRNLVIEQCSERKQVVFTQAQPFVLGDRDGSHFDEWTGEPHPLSSIKISFGSGSLRGSGLRLAVASAQNVEDQIWTRDQALDLLSSDDRSDVRSAAVALNQLPKSVVQVVEANLLVSHSNVNVRQLCAVLCMQQPDRFRDAVMMLSGDQDHRVRITLAAAARTSPYAESITVRRTLEKLAHDDRQSVRTAAVGPPATLP